MIKNFLFSLAVTLALISCEQRECCINIDAFADISVIEKSTGKDLLNQSEPNHIDINKVMLEFSTAPKQKQSISSISISKPLFFQNNGKSTLRIFPTTFEPLGAEHTVTIYWTDTNTDKLKFELKHEKQNTYTDKIFLNDTQVWDRNKGYKTITIEK
ncbi:hypothetical protein [Emticicia sp. 21SJ11W-3]|uniref:hypothetical protein n=1 Tax=Emticicia sp. 21SJ11W-3 TaxID=2916755 RepID=UPI0020A07450|nr:hypothetical protein [Emticicia sp. 21SJ11W-3]UTA69862.1 hypothetical protein MB380_08615 [Emticicia sp. 21SJ11W-3]